jgi:hypothetical protein
MFHVASFFKAIVAGVMLAYSRMRHLPEIQNKTTAVNQQVCRARSVSIYRIKQAEQQQGT